MSNVFYGFCECDNSSVDNKCRPNLELLTHSVIRNEHIIYAENNLFELDDSIKDNLPTGS